MDCVDNQLVVGTAQRKFLIWDLRNWGKLYNFAYGRQKTPFVLVGVTGPNNETENSDSGGLFQEYGLSDKILNNFLGVTVNNLVRETIFLIILSNKPHSWNRS